MKAAFRTALALWLVAAIARRWQAAGVELERARANRNPWIRKDDRR